MATELPVLLVALLSLSSFTAAIVPGVYWGTDSSQPLAAETVVELLKSNNFTKVRLSGSDPLVLRALTGSHLAVTVGVPNAMLRPLNSSRKAAHSWVHDNVTRYISALNIQYVAVGDEAFLLSHGQRFYPYVVGAARNVQAALRRAKLGGKVKVVVPCSSDAFLSDSVPSKGRFRSDINGTVTELLGFLTANRSPFFATISPFLAFRGNRSRKNSSLDFALFADSAKPLRDGRKKYRSSFDAIYSTVAAALSSLGFPRTEIVVGQTGWPTDGSPDATPNLAEAYVLGLVKRLRDAKSPPVDAYVLGLFDEDRRGIETGGFERHWGMFTFDGQAKYRLDLGRGLRSPESARGVEYLPARWCVANDNGGGFSGRSAAAAMKETCLGADCTSLGPGGSCSNVSWPGNVSYAFNRYYQEHGQSPGSCDFGGLGLITTVDPSGDRCRFTIGLGASGSPQPLSVARNVVMLGFVAVVASLVVSM